MAGARNEALIAAFSEVLKRTRQAEGLTQEQLAGRADIDRTFVGLLESGNRQPSLSVFCAIASALGKTPSALLRTVGEAAAKSTTSKT